MGTIIRITGDGVFIESSPKDNSMENSGSDMFDRKMCNLSNNGDTSGHQMTRTKSSFLNSRGQFSGLTFYV